VGFPGAGVTDQTQWLAGLDPGAGRELVDHRRRDGGVRGEVELFDPFCPWEPGGGDPPNGSPFVPVVAFGHHEFGEEPQVGQLFSFGCGGNLSEPGPDSRQPQQPAGGIDRGGRGFFGDSPPGGDHDDSLVSSSSYCDTDGNGRASAGSSASRRSVRLTTRSPLAETG
jgi:hypothetical protein